MFSMEMYFARLASLVRAQEETIMFLVYKTEDYK